MSITVEKNTEDNLDTFYSHAQNMAMTKSRYNQARETRFKAAAYEKKSVDDNAVEPVKVNSSKKYITKSGNKVASKACEGNTFRYTATSANPHQAQIQNERLNKLIVERAHALKR